MGRFLVMHHSHSMEGMDRVILQDNAYISGIQLLPHQQYWYTYIVNKPENHYIMTPITRYIDILKTFQTYLFTVSLFGCLLQIAFSLVIARILCRCLQLCTDPSRQSPSHWLWQFISPHHIFGAFFRTALDLEMLPCHEDVASFSVFHIHAVPNAPNS